MPGDDLGFQVGDLEAVKCAENCNFSETIAGNLTLGNQNDPIVPDEWHACLGSFYQQPHPTRAKTGLTA